MEYDWTNITDVAGAVVLLAIIVERGLALAFQHKTMGIKLEGWKELIAFGLSFMICQIYQIDLLYAMFEKSPRFGLGYFLTAGVIAGGSKASIALFERISKPKPIAEESSKTDGLKSSG